MIDARPLAWPEGRPRTKPYQRVRAPFDTSLPTARDAVMNEIRLLGGKDSIISSNLQCRNDGLPYSGQREPEDSGVAVYFTYRRQQMCFACDKWNKARDNLQAVRKTIEALRGIARWGTGDMMERAFTGFKALPAPGAAKPWWLVLGFDSPSLATLAAINARFNELAKTQHPDKGGDPHAFDALRKARDEGRRIMLT